MLPLVSHGAEVTRIVRRRGTMATPTARATVRRREKDSVLAARGAVDQADPDPATSEVRAVFVPVARVVVVVPADSDQDSVLAAPVVQGWDRVARAFFPKTRRWLL